MTLQVITWQCERLFPWQTTLSSIFKIFITDCILTVMLYVSVRVRFLWVYFPFNVCCAAAYMLYAFLIRPLFLFFLFGYGMDSHWNVIGVCIFPSRWCLTFMSCNYCHRSFSLFIYFWQWIAFCYLLYVNLEFWLSHHLFHCDSCSWLGFYIKVIVLYPEEISLWILSWTEFLLE